MEMTTHRATEPGPARDAGFTLIEVIVSMAVMVVVLLGLLALLDFNRRVARAQINVSEVQQSLRAVQSDMVRQIRMAGRGGLPVRHEASGATGYGGMPLPLGPALGVDNDVDAGEKLGNDANATVRAGTDVLIVRGVLSTPLYQVSPAGDGDVKGARAAGIGSITVKAKSPTGVPQELGALKKAIDSKLPEALLLVSAGTDEIHAVVEVTGGSHSADEATVEFTLNGTHGAAYRGLSPRGEFPVGLKTVAMVGLLEEYRYYVRDVQPAPRLSRARFYPGTNTPYRAATNLYVDLADNVLDLQLALGIDQDLTLQIEETETGAADDWLYNSPDDPKIETTADAAPWNTNKQPLYYLRITTLARTDRADPKYVAPAIDRIEDRVYNEPAVPADGDARLARSYRRRVLRTVVDLRNLS